MRHCQVARLILVWPLMAAGGPASQTVAETRMALAGIAKEYGIEIETKSPAFPVKLYLAEITGAAASKRALDRYGPLFVREFMLFPPELIKRTGLKKVVLCEGLAIFGQLRAAVPDWQHDTLFLDCSRGKDSKLYQNRVLHHEFFHMIDYKDDGLVYQDRYWLGLNPEGFSYGDGGAKAQFVPKTGVATNQYPGFVNHYATTGVEEDKAELFAYLMVDSAYLAGRCEQDPILKAKVARLKQRLAAYCPAVDDSFWQKAHRAKRR